LQKNRLSEGKMQSVKALELDSTDLRLLTQLQRDAAVSNQALAELVHVSPATALRRVKRLTDIGLIEKTVAILSPEVLAQAQTVGLTAIIEITLDKQGAEHLVQFETRSVMDACVQQCYQVSPGPDFVLIVHVKDMPDYQALVHRLFTQDANVRNVKAFFSVKRGKFAPSIKLS
jgi:Lrp/AsnC family transcriptional regulator, leucine-responsive regulatory protein